MYQPIRMCIYIGCIFSATSKNFCKQRIVYLSTRFTKPPSSSSPYCVAEIIAANILFLICFKFYQYHVVCICFRSLYIVGVWRGGHILYFTVKRENMAHAYFSAKASAYILAQIFSWFMIRKFFFSLWIGFYF